MTKFFVGLYNYFERHKVLFYLSLSVCILFMALFAAQVRFEENVTSFFPDTKDSQNAINVFENLKIKDKIMIMLSGKDGVADADSLIEAAETIKQDLQQQAEGTLIKEIFSKADENLINSVGDFVYDNLPLFLSDEAYQRLDTLLTAGNIAALMQKNYSNLISPAGFALKNYIMRDPLGLGSQTLKHLQDFQLEANYELINEHIFSRDGSTLLMFITPVFNTGSTGKNDKLIRLIENELQKAEKEHPQLVAEYFGGPSVGVYNARQIKKDTLVTSSIALIIIIVFISLVFKHKKSIPLIITPVLFGALFALCLIYFIKGGISAIAVGAGSAVMGIALSYSIHMLAHQNHVSSVQQLIREIAYPLTVGSFTTIGAFFRPPLYQFQPVTGFRSVRLACLDRNHAVLPGLSAAFPERAGACKTRGGATLYRETERLSIRKEQRLGRGHSRADHNMFIHLAERAFQRGYDESEL